MSVVFGGIAHGEAPMRCVSGVHERETFAGFTPASGAEQVAVPEGAPAATQLSMVAVSAASRGGFGGCGIGAAVSWIRVSTTSYTFWLGLERAGAWRSAYVTSGIGAPNCGGELWHFWQLATRTASTAQGNAGTTPALPEADSEEQATEASTTASTARARATLRMQRDVGVVWAMRRARASSVPPRNHRDFGHKEDVWQRRGVG